MDAAAVAISHRRAQEKAGTAELIALSQLSPEPACQKLATNPVGLAEDEAARRLRLMGPISSPVNKSRPSCRKSGAGPAIH